MLAPDIKLSTDFATREEFEAYCQGLRDGTAGRDMELERACAMEEALRDLLALFKRVAPTYKLDTLGLEIARVLDPPAD
jgi:hypothetical protein